MPQIIPIITAATGVAGLLSANSASNRQNDLLERGNEVNDQVTRERLDVMRMLRELVRGHDYDAETNRAVGRANEVATDSLEKGMNNFNSKWMEGGGRPGSSTEYHVRQQGAIRGVMDPLRSFVADRESQKHLRQMADLQAILGIPTGDLASGYFKGAQMSGGGDYSGGLRALVQGLGGLFPQGRRSGGAGGTGDDLANFLTGNNMGGEGMQ